MATALVDEWSEEKCLQLIREYRARPILWAQKDPFFFKKALKPIAWQEIGEALNISADQCKHKMIILMSSFRREKAKIIQSIKNVNITDSGQVYKSTWFAFKEMAFLLDKESERKRQLNDSDVGEDDENSADASMKLTLLSHHLDTPVIPVKRPRNSGSITKETPQKKVCRESEEIGRLAPTTIPQLQPRPGPSQTPSEREEEIKSFTSFIGNKMKKYSDTTKNAVQQAICDIIFRADQNFYENSCYEKFTIIDDDMDPLNKQSFDNVHDRTIIKIQNDSDSDCDV